VFVLFCLESLFSGFSSASALNQVFLIILRVNSSLVSPRRLEKRCVRLNSGHRPCSLGEFLLALIHPPLVTCSVLHDETNLLNLISL
jgi:hypothetical protein